MEENKKVNETAVPEKTTAPAKKSHGRRGKKKKGKKILIVLVLLLIGGGGAFAFLKNKKETAMSAAAGEVQTAMVTRMDISSELTGSSSLSPKDTYEVTSLVEGEVLEALFEEGDVVEKGQILYVIDASSMDSDLSSAETTLLRAQEKAADAKKDYNEAVNTISGNTYKSTATGYVKQLYISEGDKVGNGTKIADIYDDSIMKLTVPFLSLEAAEIEVGAEAIITLEDSGEQLPATVTVVSSMEEVLSGGRLVKAVTVEVSNPGGLTTLTQATVTIGDFVCSEEGNFVPKTEKTMTADLSGNGSLEVGSLLISEGSHVEIGTALFSATSESAQDYIKNFKDSLDSANDSVENAENKLSNTQDNIEDYTITAPISGTVITKNAKVGDKISKSSSGSSTLAVIYDLSAMTLEMSVDELDVRSVEVGQEVTITADAIEGETFSGTVTNVSLQGSYSSGVTNYPVTVTMTETGDLLPGMNVDAEVTLEKSENTLCIPVGALMRGNRVYVKEGSASAVSAENEDSSKMKVMPKDDDMPKDGEMPESMETPENMEAPEGMEMPKKSDGGSDNRKSAQMGSGAPDGFVAVQVETGIINDNYVEILSGLEEGDEVYVDPNAGSTTTNMFQMGMPGGGMPGGGNMGGGPGGGMPGGGNRGNGGNMGGGRP